MVWLVYQILDALWEGKESCTGTAPFARMAEDDGRKIAVLVEAIEEAGIRELYD